MVLCRYYEYALEFETLKTGEANVREAYYYRRTLVLRVLMYRESYFLRETYS